MNSIIIIIMIIIYSQLGRKMDTFPADFFLTINKQKTDMLFLLNLKFFLIKVMLQSNVANFTRRILLSVTDCHLADI